MLVNLRSFDFTHKVIQLDEFIASKNKEKVDENSFEIVDKNASEKVDEKETVKEINDHNETQFNDNNDMIKVKETVKNETLKEDRSIKQEKKSLEKEEDNNETIEENITETVNYSNIQNKSIHYYIALKDQQKLMDHLHKNCNNDLITSIYDHFYKESPNFYINLCEEGIKLNNAVSHNKYAIYLIFNECNDKSNAKSPEQIRMKFDEARFHLEKSIQQGYIKSYFLLARILHEYFHEDNYAYKIAHEGSIKGDKYSKCLLGYFITKEIGTTKNHQKGVVLMLESGANDYYEKFSTDIGIYYTKLIIENENCPKKVSLYYLLFYFHNLVYYQST